MWFRFSLNDVKKNKEIQRITISLNSFSTLQMKFFGVYH
jgi:hypothetical protein